MDQEKLQQIAKTALEEIKPELETLVKSFLSTVAVKLVLKVVEGVIASTENKIDDTVFALLKTQIEGEVQKLIQGIKI